MRVVLKRARHFITCSGKFYGANAPEEARLQLIAAERIQNAKQLSLFDEASALPATLFDPMRALLPLQENRTSENDRFLLYSGKEAAKSVLSGEL